MSHPARWLSGRSVGVRSDPTELSATPNSGLAVGWRRATPNSGLAVGSRRSGWIIRLIADGSELNSCGNRKQKYWLLSTFDDLNRKVSE
jgi:hypothetical protein